MSRRLGCCGRCWRSSPPPTRQEIGGSALRFQLANPAQRPAAQAVVSELLGDGVLPNTDPTALSVKVPDASRAAEVLSALSRAEIKLSDFSLGAPSLDDVFFALTGRPPEESAQPKEEHSS